MCDIWPRGPTPAVTVWGWRGSTTSAWWKERGKNKKTQQATSSAGGASQHSQTDVERDADAKPSCRISSLDAPKRDVPDSQQDRWTDPGRHMPAGGSSSQTNGDRDLSTARIYLYRAHAGGCGANSVTPPAAPRRVWAINRDPLSLPSTGSVCLCVPHLSVFLRSRWLCRDSTTDPQHIPHSAHAHSVQKYQ